MNEYNYYNDLAKWSFEDIDYSSENYTNWIFEDEMMKYVDKNSKVLDLGTAAGEKLLTYYPHCAEILGTDFSDKMIQSACRNLIKSRRDDVSFKVMDNLNLDTPNDYFDLVTARHTVTNPAQIYKTLKKGGHILIRGVDKLDCWELKRLFGMGQAYFDEKPISLIDYEAVIDAGFEDVELIPLHVIEYFKTKEDLYAFLMKVPILIDLSDKEENECKEIQIDEKTFEQYVASHITPKGIKLIRRYYGIVGKK